MPRLARLDTPGILHHVMGRGIERKEIFFNDTDRTDFIDRLAALCEEGAMDVYAWVLMPNHFHLLCKTNNRPLSSSMRKILTGYVVNFNRRHRRYGHLFQNRYKSIVCQEDRYLKELVRYIHLISLGELRSGSRRRDVVEARCSISWIAVRELGYSGADVARYLGVSNSCVTRLVASGKKPDVDDLIKNL
jgi:REP element-mobilizing transposase RayT